jgi:hypothetical protein
VPLIISFEKATLKAESIRVLYKKLLSNLLINIYAKEAAMNSINIHYNIEHICEYYAADNKLM